MSDFRQDRTNGFWVIIAPERAQRPHEPKENRAANVARALYDPSCPFCSGNEAMLPEIIEEVGAAASPFWLTRVVPNKFPIIDTGETAAAGPPGSGRGIHEVIIETPRHDADLPDLSLAEFETVIETWHQRFGAAIAQPGIESVILFRNHGRAAGASLLHPHSQLVAMPLVPPRLAQAQAWARARHHEDRCCVTCNELILELGTGERVIDANDEFVVLVPFAASSPFEQWIVPRRHTQSFHKSSVQERKALAATVQQALRRLVAVAGDVPSNLLIEPGSPALTHTSAVHWSARIVPDLATPGGFEMISGMPVNPSKPEQDAERLRTGLAGCR